VGVRCKCAAGCWAEPVAPARRWVTEAFHAISSPSKLTVLSNNARCCCRPQVQRPKPLWPAAIGRHPAVCARLRPVGKRCGSRGQAAHPASRISAVCV
jgi:hypothetical protein